MDRKFDRAKSIGACQECQVSAFLDTHDVLIGTEFAVVVDVEAADDRRHGSVRNRSTRRHQVGQRRSCSITTDGIDIGGVAADIGKV